MYLGTENFHVPHHFFCFSFSEAKLGLIVQWMDRTQNCACHFPEYATAYVFGLEQMSSDEATNPRGKRIRILER